MGVQIISYKNAYKDFKQTTSIQGIAEILQNACACLIFQITLEYQQYKTRSNCKMVNIGVHSFS